MVVELAAATLVHVLNSKIRRETYSRTSLASVLHKMDSSDVDSVDQMVHRHDVALAGNSYHSTSVYKSLRHPH